MLSVFELYPRWVPLMQRLCIHAVLSYKTFRSSQIVEGGHLMILLISNQLKKSEKKVCI